MSSIVPVEGRCLEAPGLALPIGALTGLAQVPIFLCTSLDRAPGNFVKSCKLHWSALGWPSTAYFLRRRLGEGRLPICARQAQSSLPRRGARVCSIAGEIGLSARGRPAANTSAVSLHPLPSPSPI
jgi:hypothetical protein